MATGITVRVGDDPDGKVIKGVTGYSVDEESTPVDPSDSTGATGRFSVSFFRNAVSAIQAKRMRRKTVRLEDRGLGTTTGIARVPSYAQGVTQLSVDLRTTLLSVVRVAQPYNGDVAGYFTYLLGLVGITTDFVIDGQYVGMPATFPGWEGDVWYQMKKLLAAKGAEVSLASDNIVLRPLRGRVTVDKRDIEFSWSVDDTNLALSVEGYWYTNTYTVNGLAYPKGGWNPNVQVYQVDANETITFDLPLEVSLSSVQQPTVMNNVTREYSASSAYCVMGNDGLPITAAQWNAAGGSMIFEIGEDTKSLLVTIVGADIAQYAPFRIAATAGPSDNYSSLRVVGTGVFFEKSLLVMPTAVSPDVASQELGATVDSEFITSYDELLDRLIWTLARFGGSRQSITVRTTGINRQGDSGSYVYPTIADFNEYAVAQGWTDIADFNTAYSGDTIADFNEWWFATVAGAFVNQAFGNVAGARTRRDNVWYRIRRATETPDDVSYSAEGDTTIGDFNDEWNSNSTELFPFPGFENPTGTPANQANTNTLGYTTVSGVSYARGTASSTSASSIRVTGNAERSPVVAGEHYYARLRVQNPNAGSRAFTASLRFYDTSGATLGTELASFTPVSGQTIAAGDHFDFEMDGVAPVGSVSAVLVATRSSGSGAAVSDLIYATGAHLSDSELAPSIAVFNAEMTSLGVASIADFNVAPLERVAA